MLNLTSVYKKRKGIDQSTKALDADAIVQMFLNIAPKVNAFSVNSKIFAKESMSMPMMARDTNITRQNIAKLLKIQGGSPVRKADSFFERASEREKLYESNFSKESSSLKTKPIAPTGVSGFAQKAVNFGAMSLGLVGFFGAIALAGNLISKIPGGLDGMKDMFVALAEGLSAFSLDSFLKFGAILAAGALFGTVTGIKGKAGAMLGIGAIGLGIGLFFSGLAVGGAIGDIIGNSAGIKTMMTNFAEGLNAFSGESFVSFSTLLGAGALFGAVTGLSAKGGAMLGMGAIGLGMGLFFSGLAVGGALASTFTNNPTMIKDLLVNVAEGLNALSQINASALAPLIVTLPLFGGALLGFLVTNGIAGIVEKLATGLDKAINFLIGNDEYKSPIQKLAEDMKKISEVSDMTKANDGIKNLMETLKIIVDLSGDKIQKAINNTGIILSLLERLNRGKFPTRPGAPASGPGSAAGRKVEEHLYTGPFGIPAQTGGPTPAAVTPAPPATRPTPAPGAMALGKVAEKYETGGRGSATVGWDSVGGTSYGKYQIASKVGAMTSFLKFIESRGHKELAAKLRASGIEKDTGSNKGPPVDAWKQAVAAGELGNLEHEFIKTRAYDPAMGMLKSAELKKLINDNRGLQEMLWSTAVQHGPSGAASILNSVYTEGMSSSDLIEKVYAVRGTKFRSSTAQVQNAVLNRFKNERQDIIAAMNAAPIDTNNYGTQPTMSASTQTASRPSVASAAPSTGATIASSSSSVNDARMAMNATPPSVVVNASGSNNNRTRPVDTKISSTMDFDFTDSMFGAPLGA